MVTVRPGKIKIPSAEIDRGKSTDTKPDSQGCLGKAFAHFYKEVAGELRVPIEGILNVWHGYQAKNNAIGSSLRRREVQQKR